MGKKEKDGGHENKTIQNRRARFEYEFTEFFEAGISLIGSEVKSLAMGRAHLSDSYCRILNHEAFLCNFDIDPYEHAGAFGHDRRRDRKLLLHKREIEELDRAFHEKGLSIIPTKVYFKAGRAKVELGVGRGKKLHDKRESIANREATRDAAREIARANKGR